MIISQGFLPNDSERIDPSTDLEAWISGTEIYSLEAAAFSGSTLQFVYSQTDAPATDSRTEGMLWFKRGDGRLYIWDKPDPSEVLTGIKGWICLSDRRELWVRHCGPSTAPLGTPLTYINGPTDPVQFYKATDNPVNSDPNYRVIWPIWPFVNDSSSTIPRISEFLIVAAETAESDSVFRAIEQGFCYVRMVSGASDGTGFLRITQQSETYIAPIDGFNSIETAQSEIDGMVVGYLCDVSEDRLRYAFKYALPVYGESIEL